MTEPKDAIALPEGACMRDYQDYIRQLDALHGWQGADIVRKCFLMGEEVGELFGAVRTLDRLSADDPRRPAAVTDAGEEIVDVLNYLLALANRLDIDVEAAFREKNRRNQRRRWAD